LQSRKHSLIIGVLFLGTIVSVAWFVFHCGGWDWTWTEDASSTLYAGFWKYKEYPYFSFFNNGGVYQLQDPVGILVSVNALMGIFLGPVTGLRWAIVFLALLGLVGMYIFMKEAVGRPAATLCSIFWVTSLGFAWRFAAGEDILAYWYLLPLTLVLYENLWRNPTCTNMVGLGLWMGLIILGPCYHALIYMILPALFLFAPLLFVFDSKKKILQFSGFLLFSILIATCVASPRVASWITLKAQRGRDPFDGVISIGDALYCLFATARTSFSGFRIVGPPGEYYRGIWESNVSLMPPASILAVIGLLPRRFLPQKDPKIFTKKIFAIVLIVSGLALSTQLWLWRLLQNGFFAGVRVPSRFLVLSAFALAILSGLGLNFVLQKIPTRFRAGFLIVILVSSFAFMADWVNRATKDGTLKKEAIPLLSLPSISQNLNIVGPGVSASPAAILEGRIVINSLCPVGSGCISKDYGDPKDDPLVKLTSPTGVIFKPEKLSVTNLTFQVFSLQPHETRLVYLRYPRLGYSIDRIEPADARVILRPSNFLIQVENLSDVPVASVLFKVLPPIPLWPWLLSGATSLLGILAVLVLWYRKNGFAANEST
jgi:hypothetical protein